MKKRPVGLLALLAMSAFMLSGCTSLTINGKTHNFVTIGYGNVSVTFDTEILNIKQKIQEKAHMADGKDLILKDATPENSVLCYGRVLGTDDGAISQLHYIQVDESKSPWTSTVKGKKKGGKAIINSKIKDYGKRGIKSRFPAKTVVLPPCEPGASLRALRSQMSKWVDVVLYQGGQMRHYPVHVTSDYKKPANATGPMDIDAPKKPGLYYIGSVFADGEAYTAASAKKRLGGDKEKVKKRTQKAVDGELENIDKNLLLHEIVATEALLKLYKNTAWEPVIQARLEVLNAKK